MKWERKGIWIRSGVIWENDINRKQNQGKFGISNIIARTLRVFGPGMRCDLSSTYALF